MTKPKAINRKKLVAFVLPIFQQSEGDKPPMSKKKETADFAGALRRQGRARGGIKESQAKGKDAASSAYQADTQRQNAPTLYESRYVGEFSAEPRIADGR